MLAGCGGNGAQMPRELASLDTALRAISTRSLDVVVVDDDTVSEANLGRQPFHRCDLGASEARTLVERINIAHGLAGRALHGRAPQACGVENIDILISCVDTASARRALGCLRGDHVAADLLTRPRQSRDRRSAPDRLSDRNFGRNEHCLPTVLDYFPELADDSLPDDDMPSCSVVEALERLSLSSIASSPAMRWHSSSTC
ncbi:PRTRC genetic system ThiF family protein [Sphingomonas zeicaulis]|uniref:PRTRC system ThiF family protein n=1 Tax=Sphingomonas zeicaulis TaxID=1632740 RepID=UPI003D21FCAF